jgi:nitroimidazol reductase NimA-like FMN-containing flavoprotein (pyridoxamine 5'-phosphate oxidase superfamily)
MSPLFETIDSREELEAILKETEVCRLGLRDNGMPYIIPMNFGCKDNTLYFHSARTGHKIDLLERDPRISFQCESEARQVRDEGSGKWMVRTLSVMAEGRAAFIAEPEDKREAMKLIMSRYSGGMEFEYSDETLGEMALIRVPIETIQGRKILR